MQKYIDFEKAMELVAVTCGTETFEAFEHYGGAFLVVARAIADNHDPDEWTDSFPFIHEVTVRCKGGGAERTEN